MAATVKIRGLVQARPLLGLPLGLVLLTDGAPTDRASFERALS